MEMGGDGSIGLDEGGGREALQGIHRGYREAVGEDSGVVVSGGYSRDARLGMGGEGTGDRRELK